MSYKNLYLKTSSKEGLFVLFGEEFDSYYETEDFIIDWIGKIPISIDEEEIELTEYYCFNVYTKPGGDVSIFDEFEKSFPYTPFRIMAQEDIDLEMKVVPFQLVYDNIDRFDIQKIVGPFGEEGSLEIEVFYRLRRTGEDYKIKEVETGSEILPYKLSPELDVVSILERVKDGNATQTDIGIINMVLQGFNGSIELDEEL